MSAGPGADRHGSFRISVSVDTTGIPGLLGYGRSRAGLSELGRLTTTPCLCNGSYCVPDKARAPLFFR